MRQITNQSINAFLNGYNFNGSNMQVKHENNVSYMYLNGNAIAKRQNGQLYITNAGWSTNTTKERLNALPNVRIQQKAFSWYLNGREWTGEWTNPEEWDEQTKLINESKNNFLI